jgi:DNA-binding CsgD family transcriptional regulator
MKGAAMDSPLTHGDWNRINDLILQMNYENDILKALNLFLVGIDKIVPYEKASIYFYTLSEDKLNVDTCISQGFGKKELKVYDDYYCRIDDIIDKMLPTKLTTIRSNDIFNLNQRKQTEYYHDYVRPVRTHFSLDSNFKWNKNDKETNFGSLDLFRHEKDGDFTNRELEICKILQPHLETKASQYVFSFVDSLEKILLQYALTKTENEVARLILRGYTNEQISKEKFITVSTVKKHVTNILEKSKSGSRIEFICKINFNGKIRGGVSYEAT